MNLLSQNPAWEFLVAHELANILPMIKGADFDNLKADIAKQGIVVPIVLFAGQPDGTKGPIRILDGRNRHAAALACGHKFVPANFDDFVGTYAEAEAFVVSTNLQRRQLTNSQKSAVIISMIAKHPRASNRQIAKICGLSHVTVGAARERMENPPEKKQFDAFRRTWEELADDQREAFVREFAADIRELLGA